MIHDIPSNRYKNSRATFARLVTLPTHTHSAVAMRGPKRFLRTWLVECMADKPGSIE